MVQLLSIKIKNYRSFYSEQVLRFGNEKTRCVTAIYGPNAGGKSNTARAIRLLQDMIINSAKADYVLPYDPFLLKEGSSDEDSFFEIVFSSGNRVYSYSIAFNAEQITSETMLVKSEKVNRMKTIFTRDKDGITNLSAEKYGFGKRLIKKTRKETLLITKAREDNNAYANMVFDFVGSIVVIPGEGTFSQSYAIELLRRNTKLKKKTIELMQDCDFSIRDIKIEEGELIVQTAHAIRNEDRKVIGMRDFNLESQESMGTKKFFEIAVPIVHALEEGMIVYLDEFASHFHPILANAIIELFKSEINIKNAAIILNTHNTAILSLAGISRDDVFFVDKNLSEESVIIPLTQKAVRLNESYEKRYREGLYGSIPNIKLKLSK